METMNDRGAAKRANPPEADALSIGALSSELVFWKTSLQAQNKSANTIKLYLDAGRLLEDFLTQRGMPTAAENIKREHVEAFIVDLQARTSASTAATRYRGLKQLFRYLVDEGAIASSPMERMTPPKVGEAPVPVIGHADLERLFKVCGGTTFEARRDLAIFRLLLSSGLRVNELVEIKVVDLDLPRGEVTVTGKGSKVRRVAFSPKAAQALSRYLRVRAKHPQKSLPYLWIGLRGRLTGSGVRQILEARCVAAGIQRINPHRFRHTWAHETLAKGGNEHDLATNAGWTSTQMVARYGASAAAERAREAQRQLGVGEEIG
jgi:site-specific recombinase XerD